MRRSTLPVPASPTCVLASRTSALTTLTEVGRNRCGNRGRSLDPAHRRCRHRLRQCRQCHPYGSHTWSAPARPASRSRTRCFPKKCGHFNGKDVISRDEMVQKIKAAVDARHDQSLQIIARTDARAGRRSRTRPRASARLRRGGRRRDLCRSADRARGACAASRRAVAVPQVANIVFGGKTPDPGRDKLAELGFSIVLYANAALQAALKACLRRAWRAQGGRFAAIGGDRLASFDERQRAVAKDKWDAREARYRG